MSSLPRNVYGRLSHRFPAIGGVHIKTVKRRMRWYDGHTERARTTASIDVGIGVPAPLGGS